MGFAHELISIIMPTKNAGSFLAACLDSICQQTYSNWELWVVNDHSNDNTQEILDFYAANDARIHVLQNEAYGIIPALQLASKHISGVYVSRMDADDLMPAQKLDLLYQALQGKEKAWLATGKVAYFSDGNLGEGYLKYAQWLNTLCEENRHFEEIYKECVIPSPCWLMRTNDFLDLGGFETAQYPEDYDWVFRVYERNFQVAAVQEVCHYWRDHGSRASRNDPNYLDNRFLDLKLHYFLKLDYNPSKMLVLWGAGAKGKWLAQTLLKRNIPFVWVCNNQQKIGKEINGQIMFNSDAYSTQIDAQFIVSVANPLEQDAIRKQLKSGEAYFFC